METDFDKMAHMFTIRMQAVANWKQTYFGAAYRTRIKSAIREARQAIAEAEAHPEIGKTE